MPCPSSGLRPGKVPADLLGTLLADLPDAPRELICGPAIGQAADPWATLASGALLVTFPQALVDHAVGELTHSGHVAAVVGAVGEGVGVSDQAGVAISWPERDEVARILQNQDTTVST